MKKIEVTITWTGTQEQIDLLLNTNLFTGLKPSYDENGQPVVDEETGQPVMEEMPQEEYLSYLVKEGSIHGGGIMPMIRGTTATLQEKFGSLQYNAKQMNETLSNIINVETTIEEI